MLNNGDSADIGIVWIALFCVSENGAIYIINYAKKPWRTLHNQEVGCGLKNRHFKRMPMHLHLEFAKYKGRQYKGAYSIYIE